MTIELNYELLVLLMNDDDQTYYSFCLCDLLQAMKLESNFGALN